MTPKERAVMQQALEALEYHTEQTCPIQSTIEAITALREALAEQAEQKPVALVEVERGIPMFMDFAEDYKPNINNGIAPLYAAPVRTKDLTDDEIWKLTGNYGDLGWQNCTLDFARAVIAADREKNK